MSINLGRPPALHTAHDQVLFHYTSFLVSLPLKDTGKERQILKLIVVEARFW